MLCRLNYNMLNVFYILAVACLILPWPQVALAASQVPDYIEKQLPDAALVGEGRLSVMVWNVYDARLWAEKGVYNPEAPFVLELTYLRNIKGRQIADTTAEEIRRQGFNNEIKIAAWHRQLRKIIPNVDTDITLAGFADAAGHTVFFHNGREIGKVEDTAFTKQFFDIWLGQKTSHPRLRAQLTGQGR